MAPKTVFTRETTELYLSGIGYTLLEYIDKRPTYVRVQCNLCNLVSGLRRLAAIVYEKKNQICKNCRAASELNRMTSQFLDHGYRLLSKDSSKIGYYKVECVTCGKVSSKLPGHVYADRGCMGCRILKKEIIRGNIRDYRNFYRRVRTLTASYVKKFDLFPDIEISREANHIDHIRSVYDCYLDNLSPETISHPVNLQAIPAKENTSKNKRSYISKAELLEMISDSQAVGRFLI